MGEFFSFSKLDISSDTGVAASMLKLQVECQVHLALSAQHMGYYYTSHKNINWQLFLMPMARQ
jgi:hypothetical protein